MANADFWRTGTSHRDGKSALAGEVGGCTPTLFQPHVQVAVNAPAEMADTLPVFNLYPICTLWDEL